MFGTVCDTVRCKGVPVRRCVRDFVVRASCGRHVGLHTDRELCADCLPHFEELVYGVEHGTLSAWTEPLAARAA